MISDMRILNIYGDEKIDELLVRVSRNQHIYLTRHALVTLLQRYITGDVSSELIHEFANVLEMNEFVNQDQPADQAINDALFKLANPEINSELSVDLAKSIVETLVDRQQ
jgi:hypothetical protein